MPTESFLVATLPRTADPQERVHVSLFITHRLTPDGEFDKVIDFPNIVDWTDRLLGARFELIGLGGGTRRSIPITPLLDQLEPKLWPRVFPDDLFVRPWQTPDPTSEEWRTFAAHRAPQHALLAHGVSLLSSPVSSPSVNGNVLSAPLLNTIGYGQFTRSLTVDYLLEAAADLDASATQYLDQLAGGGVVGRGYGYDDSSHDGGQPLRLLAADAHRARLFYARPEGRHEYSPRPVEGAERVPVAKPDPDFHERASLLGDLSPLLRRLGLIIDLHIEDLTQLNGVTAIRAQVEVPELANTVKIQPATACKVDGTDFFATSASGDYSGPLLRLGDEERFRVLDLDPDAAGLKVEQYMRTLPRLQATETNGDPTSSAPGTLRATGFSLARIDRAEQLQEHLQDAPARDAAVMAGTAPPLSLEDIARGVRLEVWDDVSEEWHSLHKRRVDVEVEGAGLVLKDAPDTGFLQGASLTRLDGEEGGVDGSPYYAHEVLAGWDGWSLAAPRPGKVVVHEDGKEVLKDEPDPDPDPVNPVATTSRIEPLTLPWLRYGRRYAFRAWAVDLAGNSAPHEVAGPNTDPGVSAQAGAQQRRGKQDDRRRVDTERLQKAAEKVAAARLEELPADATVSRGRPESDRAAAALRDGLRKQHPVVEPGPREGAGAGGADLTTFAPTGFDDVDNLVRQRLLSDRKRRPIDAPGRQERIEAGFSRQIAGLDALLERTDKQTPAALYAKTILTAAITHPGLPAFTPALIARIADLVTTPRPFLRWDPVIEPAIVPRNPYTEAESLRTLVIRSGVEGPSEPDGLELEIVAPADYSSQVLADHPSLGLEWREDSQRHLAPPKSSQFEAELHGNFDAAFGGASEAAVRTALGIALRESGSFLDPTVADIANPGERLPQPGIALHTGPTAEVPEITDPADLGRGDPLGRGQYVVHDTDDLVLPYLPDPLAAGLSMVFPDAGKDHKLFGLFATEGVRLDYIGSWPEPRPYRMVLESGDSLYGRVDSNVISLQVPPGEQLRMRLSSALTRDSLDLMGLWRSLPAVLRNIDFLAEAAADGWYWWLTPPTEIRLVHAVPRPVEVPRPTILLPARLPNDTAVTLAGGIDLHGPSTERLDVEAAWSEWVDDLAKPGPERIDVTAAAAHTMVGYDEDLVVLANADKQIDFPDGSELNIHKAVHELGDTKHRDIDYRMRATSRYREYFDPRVVPTPDDVSVVGPTRRLDVPSTARPAKPIVRDVIPMFRWYEETEPEQPFGLRRTRRAGLRLYLDRPWYSSGDNEQLAVVLAHTASPGNAFVSRWGGDPVFWQQGPAAREILPLVDIPHLLGLDDRRQGARPIEPPTVRQLVDVAGQPSVWVLGYEPEYSEERGLWFTDIAVDPGRAIWPFVRLAVARYQPSSLPAKHLSPVVVCDFVPLPPERTATLTRPDNRHARIVVTGPIGVPDLTTAGAARRSFFELLVASRVMRVRLEHKIADVKGDLGWETVAKHDLPILGFEGTVVSWSGELELPNIVPPRRPGDSTAWRVTVEEWEQLPADRIKGERGSGLESRMVYADHLPL